MAVGLLLLPAAEEGAAAAGAVVGDSVLGSAAAWAGTNLAGGAVSWVGGQVMQRVFGSAPTVQLPASPPPGWDVATGAGVSGVSDQVTALGADIAADHLQQFRQHDAMGQYQVTELGFLGGVGITRYRANPAFLVSLAYSDTDVQVNLADIFSRLDGIAVASRGDDEAAVTWLRRVYSPRGDEYGPWESLADGRVELRWHGPSTGSWDAYAYWVWDSDSWAPGGAAWERDFARYYAFDGGAGRPLSVLGWLVRAWSANGYQFPLDQEPPFAEV